MTSREYWRKREKEALEHYITEEAEYTKRINEIYDYMLDNVSKEINGFYTKYAKDKKISMAEAKKAASKLDMKQYSRKAKRYVKDKDFSSQANAEMKLYNLTMKVNRLELLKANIGLEMVGGFDELEKYFGDILDARTIEELERQAGILGQTIGDNAKAADAIVNASFNNAKYSDRIWMYQGMLKNELSSLLATGLIQGRHPNELSRHLQKLFGVQKNYADRLMRTELCRVQTEAQKQSYERGGYEQYVFITTHDAKTCTLCRPLDGQTFNLKDMQIGENAPPMHPNCRCSTAAYMDRAATIKRVEAMSQVNSGKVPEKSKSIFKNQSKDNIIYSGARILNPDSDEGKTFAKMYYSEIRSFSTDFSKIAKNIGANVDDIKKIKEYLFYNEDFEPDCAIAQSWQRLMLNKDIKQHDRTLINHELYEMEIKKNNPDIEHYKAHEMATKKYNYQKEATEYYGNINKNRKTK